MINKVILVGRLGRDPEMHYTSQGTTVTTFPMATDHSDSRPEEASNEQTV